MREDLIADRCAYTGDVIKVTDAFGRFNSLKMALVIVRSPAFGTNKVFEVKAAVEKDLQWKALLGNSIYRDCPEIANNVEVRVRKGVLKFPRKLLRNKMRRRKTRQNFNVHVRRSDGR